MFSEERFWAKVDTVGDCWEWTAARHTRSGHGIFGWWDGERNHTRYAHRLSYELLVGPIPEGLTLDHLCRNTVCVNPDHLEPVTSGVNVLRGFGSSAQRARQTHCKHGHEFTEANTYIDKRGWRHCRACGRDHARRNR